MATINAKKAIPFDVGAIESGMLADLVVIDASDLSILPKEKILSHLVYSLDTSAIKKVMIGGKWIYDGGFLTVDEKKVVKDFEKAYTDLNSRL